jgi:agmatine deiminase
MSDAEVPASAGGARSEPQAGEVYSWPGEFEPHDATWLAWPHNPDTWPGRLEAARGEFAVFVRELSAREPVRLLVADAAMEEPVRRRLADVGADLDRLELVQAPTDDAWLRDTGPIAVRRAGERVLLDFGFNAWGGKYPPWERDQAVPRVFEKRLGWPRIEVPFVLEGGSVDGDGDGTVLTTESCLLNPNRGAGRTRDIVERLLGQWLGARQVLWLGDGIAGDDTDGHVDDVARFVGPGTVVAAEEPDASDPNHAPLAENLRRLRRMRDARGRPLSVATLPMPPPTGPEDARSPASYANFYLAEGVALVPTFGADSDARALAVLRELLPGRDVVAVPCSNLVVGLGALHCLSQQEPA